jgi:dihydroorotate dehydrogenase electron transfer subunit
MPQKPLIQDLRVVKNTRLNARHFLLDLQGPEPLPEILPGHFAQIRVDRSPETFLRRPFSIHRVDQENNILRFLLQIKGDGTRTLGGAHEGDTLNVIYPLGRAFSDPIDDKVLLVGGGVGAAPLLILGDRLNRRGIRPVILTGWRTKADIFEDEEYRQVGDLNYTTEDGTEGEKGLVTQHSIFNEEKLPYSKIYCCGPDPMMHAVAKLAKQKGVGCEVSLENFMACGFGVCLCCITPTVRGNERVCVEGPVFDTRDLKWEGI